MYSKQSKLRVALQMSWAPVLAYPTIMLRKVRSYVFLWYCPPEHAHNCTRGQSSKLHWAVQLTLVLRVGTYMYASYP